MSGFSLGGAINAGADWVCNAPIIRGIISNPVFTALLITALAAIVVMATYHYQIKQAGAKRGARTLLYVFILVTMVMFVHHYAVSRMVRDSASQQGIRDVFSSIETSRSAGIYGGVPVVPMGWEDSAGAAPVTGGADGGCGCPDAAPAPPAVGRGARPDNHARAATNPRALALDDELVIEDVVVPTAGLSLRRAPAGRAAN